MSELIGRNLGPYRILEQLGMGGMATVYKAYQANMDRNVAVKVLPRHFAQDPTFVGRFEQEAKVIARLEHARILPVYDYGEDDGTTYIVMRYLDAGTLSERIQAGMIPLAETARIIGQITEGLDYAHKKGVIHRDVKPSNIMLDSNGDVYITDFGISKLIEGTAQFTGSGIVGTPDYVSPEQALGEPIDNRSDIYSLGIVLYQMATNDVPFHAETPMAVIIKHIHEPLPLPRSVNPNLPESVQSVILKALAKNPDDRFQTSGDLAKALAAAVSGAHVDAPEALLTAIPVPTRPIPSADPDTPERGVPGAYGATIPVVPPPAASEQTKAAEKKRSGIGTPLLIAGGLVVLALVALVILGALRNIRERRTAAGTATARAAMASAPTNQPATAAPPAAPGDTSGQPTAAPPPATLPGPADQPPSFEDPFEGPDLSPGWRWINEPRDKWNLAGGRLTIGVLPQTRTVALVRNVPDNIPADAHYSARVDVSVAPGQNFQQAGLIVFSERQQPLFTLARGFCDAPPPKCSGDALYMDDRRVVAQNADGYQARQAAGGALPADDQITLRLTVRPGSIIGDYSLDGGQHWALVGEWPLLRDARIGAVGLFTASGEQAAPAIPAHFDNFVMMLMPPPQ